MTKVAKPVGASVGIISSLKGLMVEVEIDGEHPEIKELLDVESCPEVYLEVSFFRGNNAVCVNLTNSQVLRYGQRVSRTNTKVTVPVGPETMGRVFNALGAPIDEGP